jgi:hypothetical protein
MVYLYSPVDEPLARPQLSFFSPEREEVAEKHYPESGPHQTVECLPSHTALHFMRPPSDKQAPQKPGGAI